MSEEKKKYFQIWLEEGLLDRIRKYALKHERSMNKQILVWIKKGLKDES